MLLFVHVQMRHFVDRSKVFQRLAKKTRTVLSRTGKATMTAMRRSMRKARKGKKDWRERLREGTYQSGDSGGSLPGEPPRWRSKKIRDAIFFAFDPKSQAVVAGPLKFKGSGRVTTPQRLNEGGTVRQTLPGGERVRSKLLPRPFATLGAPAGEVGQQTLIDQTEKVPF